MILSHVGRLVAGGLASASHSRGRALASSRASCDRHRPRERPHDAGVLCARGHRVRSRRGFPGPPGRARRPRGRPPKRMTVPPLQSSPKFASQNPTWTDGAGVHSGARGRNLPRDISPVDHDAVIGRVGRRRNGCRPAGWTGESAARFADIAVIDRRPGRSIHTAHDRHRAHRRLPGRGRRSEQGRQAGRHRAGHRPQGAALGTRTLAGRDMSSSPGSTSRLTPRPTTSTAMASRRSRSRTSSRASTEEPRDRLDPDASGRSGGPVVDKEIDRVPTSHRLRFADIEGNGKKVLVNFPLIGSQRVAPDYRDTSRS